MASSYAAKASVSSHPPFVDARYGAVNVLLLQHECRATHEVGWRYWRRPIAQPKKLAHHGAAQLLECHFTPFPVTLTSMPWHAFISLRLMANMGDMVAGDLKSSTTGTQSVITRSS